ncbi:MAG: triose-phosphate isomerase, partial [Rhodospirillaceae bacterium]|nr:triose-phosphate isomerase [Rhodospirillaceae bacterium]
MAIRPLIAGNWKMNNGTITDAVRLTRAVVATLKGGAGLAAEVALCPPFTVLQAVGETLAGTAIALGGQDCHEKPSGAYTGSIAAPMLKDAGCRYVILGHSERRHGLGETDALVHAKIAAAWGAGLVPILCLGETAAERDAGKTLAVVAGQLAGSLPPGKAPLVVAYEPVWAIGTGRVATPDDIAKVHVALRAALKEARADGGDI